MKSVAAAATFAGVALASKIVVLQNEVEVTPQSFEDEFGVVIEKTYNINNDFRAFKCEADESQVAQMEESDSVNYVSENVEFELFPALPQDQSDEATATSGAVSSYGLDRVDQRSLPLDDSYTPFGKQGEGVTVYVIDTSCLVDHEDFGGRATFGFDGTGAGERDTVGHGTHVAGTAAGTKYGVAPKADIVCVKVCAGQSCQLDAILSGVEWAAEQAAPTKAVANMSLGGRTNQAIDDAVSAAIASGLPIAVASGNSSRDSCTFSPARVPTAVTVDASDVNDRAASFTNTGTCSDVWAPGVDIPSAWNDGGENTISGTSMAAPHVAGVMALYLAENDWTPEELHNAITGFASPVDIGGNNSPAGLVYNAPDGEIPTPTETPTPTDTPTPTPTQPPCTGFCCIIFPDRCTQP